MQAWLPAPLTADKSTIPGVKANHGYEHRPKEIRMTEVVEKTDENFDAGDKCGRCGCARRDHTPGCTTHAKCKHFSTAQSRKPKPKKR